MNKQLLTISVMLIGMAVLFSFMDKKDVPDPEPGPVPNVAGMAVESYKAQGLEFGSTLRQAAAEYKVHEDPNKVHDMIKAANKKSMQESYAHLDILFDEAVKADVAAKEKANGGEWKMKLDKILEEAGVGISKAAERVK